MDSVDLALEHGASGRPLEVSGALIVKETDDAVAAKVGGVRHRRPPVTVAANQHMFADERSIARDELADGVQVVTPDRVGELHCVHESRPARSAIASRQHELRIGQLRGRGIDRFGMVFAQIGDCIRSAGVDVAEQFLGLTVKLVQVGPERAGGGRA